VGTRAAHPAAIQVTATIVDKHRRTTHVEDTVHSIVQPAQSTHEDVLARALGGRLHYPASFVGRGDMSRGGLLLRSASSLTELEYVVLEQGAVRRGPRPPRLETLPDRPAGRP